MSLKKRILKNGIAALFQKGIKVAEQLLLVPFFIKYWGAAYYGEWLTLTIVPASLALADFGFGTAAANSFLLTYASGDKQGAANIARTGIYILNFVVVGAIFLSLTIIFILKYFGTFDKLIIPSYEAISILMILLLTRILNFYNALFEAHFRSARKASISINFLTCIALCNILMGLIVLISGGRGLHYAWGTFMVVLIFNPIYIIWGRKILGLNRNYNGIIDKALIKPLLKKGFGYFLSPIWQAIYYQGMTFVIRITLGAVAVTVFNTLRTLVRSSAQAFGMTITAVYPDFQFEIGAKNYDNARKIFVRVLFINLLMAIGFVISLSLFGKQVYQWWTKNSLDVSQNIWIFFIVGIPFYATWFTFSFIFEALNKPYIVTVSGFIFSILSVIISCVLSNFIDLLGVVVGCLFFDIIMSVYLLNKIKIFGFKNLIIIQNKNLI